MLYHIEGKGLKGRMMEGQSHTMDDCSRFFPRHSSAILGCCSCYSAFKAKYLKVETYICFKFIIIIIIILLCSN